LADRVRERAGRSEKRGREAYGKGKIQLDLMKARRNHKSHEEVVLQKGEKGARGGRNPSTGRVKGRGGDSCEGVVMAGGVRAKREKKGHT